MNPPSPPVSKKKAKPAPQKRGRKRKSPTPDVDEADDADDVGKKKSQVPKGSRSKAVVSDDDDDDDDEAMDEPTSEPEVSPPKKKRVTAKAAQVRSKAVADDDDDMEDTGEEKAADVKPNVEQEDESELSEVMDEPPKRKRKPKGKVSADDTKEFSSALSSALSDITNKDKGNEIDAADSSSELSSVIDDGPAPKRKRKSKDASSTTKSTGTRKAKAAAELSPDETQIKQLQGQLLKCGVRKAWAIEFKKHGAASPKEKIRHLKQMLVDVGITGRFSEAKAKEIKERRELLDDLGAVQEWNNTFGLDGRASRRRGTKSASKNAVLGDDEEDDNGDNEGKGNADDDDDIDEEDAPTKIKSRGPARHRADLAFLDDESESD